MEISFSETGWEDYSYWQQTDKSILNKINALIKEISREPFKGIGKPEPLRGNLSGYWSRRITGEHRLVYKIESVNATHRLFIIQARFHY